MGDSDPLQNESELPRTEAHSPAADAAPPPEFPKRIGRYRIEKVLGKGGFGLVYLGHDEQLDRPVAVKVPLAKLISRPEDAEAYLTEARTVANLDHVHIVPVYDVGSTDECPCFVVSKYIEGTDLSKRINENRPSYPESAELVRAVAEALHYAHKQGIVHRDVKPGNILIGTDGKPYVVDFGLALREENIGKGPKYAGTPVYMSPEQARGEGHRVDGRSDIYSLGAVFYELLTGRRTFSGETKHDILDQIASQDPRPPRQIDDVIPKELERICLNALSKRASERYTTALDMTEDLTIFLAKHPAALGSNTPSAGETQPSSDSTQVPADSGTHNSDSQPIRIVPKGLRSFDEHDADFFLELLPGARDREGLPDSLRFWKTRIEETDPDRTFSVGLIYGPSGCGKSSLVKAGLLPRLSDDVIPVYIEATPDETETRLLHGLRKRCPGLADNLSLKDTLAALRRGESAQAGEKVLIVLDQFEQWLHTHRDKEDTDLVQALRQCDGGSVQCIVMVRDDFWMAATRFMRELEVRLVEAQNSAAVDLFPIRHAQKVLAAFGRAFGALPDDTSKTSKEQKDFFKQSVAGLAEDGKVICVRLALLAEMMKGKSWTPATLKEVGGTKGVGVTFLEETFSASTAPPEHRYHQTAARAVLKALLPESGTEIKGQMKSRNELLEASGYANRTNDFDDLVRILDSELRLITPTDTEGLKSSVEGQEPDKEGSDTAPALDSQPSTHDSFYQLTHDYLVHSLRDWLTRKQKETRRGRAELRLAERSALWNAKPENRHLPASWEYANIRLLTGKKNWSEPQRKMMSRAGRLHGIRAALLVVLLSAIAWGTFELNGWTKARAISMTLASAEAESVPDLVNESRRYRRWLGSFLEDAIQTEGNATADIRKRLNARIAMASSNDEQVPRLLNDLLRDELRDVDYLGVICDVLRPHQKSVAGSLWDTFRNGKDADTRFRAGLALAQLDPDSDLWNNQDAAFLVNNLLTKIPEEQPRIRDYLQPVSKNLYAELKRAFRESSAPERQLLGSAKALAQFADDDVARIAELASEANAAQYAVLYPVLEASFDQAVQETLRAVATQQPEEKLTQPERVEFGRRRAGAAITLLRGGDREQMFEVFRVTGDPESLTQFVHRCQQRGVTVAQLLDCLDQAEALRQTKTGDQRKLDDRVLFGVLLALGEFEETDVPDAKREELVRQLVDWYANDPSSTVHGATGWLLRHWGHEEEAEKIDQTEVPPSKDRDWFIKKIDAEIPDSTDGESKTKSFYFTFIVFEDGEYTIGSPDDEVDRQDDESKQTVRLTRRLAVLDREITREEYEAFGGKKLNIDQWSPPPGKHPMVAPSWYDSVAFCRALTIQAGLAEDDQCYADPKTLSPEDFPREPDPKFNQYPRNWKVRLDRSGFRLPTEAEWEVMCRADTGSMYCFGSDPTLLDRYGWFVDNSGKQTQLPRTLRPNLRGLFDTHGNVWEWCHDWYSSRRDVNAENPFGPLSAGSSRVLRGGGWSYSTSYCRSANRYYALPTTQFTNNGFRVVSVVLFPSRP